MKALSASVASAASLAVALLVLLGATGYVAPVSPTARRTTRAVIASAAHATERQAPGASSTGPRWPAGDYDKAVSAAARDRDQDQARWDAAEATARAGNVAGAASRFWRRSPATEGASTRPEAAFRLAVLRIDTGDP